MSEFQEFLKLVAEEKSKDPKVQSLNKVKENVKGDLGSLFEQLSKAKTEQITVQKPKEQNVTEDFIAEVSPIPAKPIIKKPEQKIVDTRSDLDKYLTNKSFQQPNPDKVDPNIKAIQEKMKFLEQAIGRIAATGPGGGEVNLRWLDDVDRPTIYDMRYLRYNDSKKKFEFAEVNPHDIVYTTHLVTTPTYVVDDDDYYIGVNYEGDVNITLPTTPTSGRMIIIKDESGNAETNPITVLGTVDNDAGGFIIQINNGAIQLIYRNGWRIV